MRLVRSNADAMRVDLAEPVMSVAWSRQCNNGRLLVPDTSKLILGRIREVRLVYIGQKQSASNPFVSECDPELI